MLKNTRYQIPQRKKILQTMTKQHLNQESKSMPIQTNFMNETTSKRL